MKLFGFDVKGVNLSKVKYAIGCIIFFTFMYFTCNDKEFAGFINSEARIYTNEDKIKYAIFKKYKNDKNDYITLIEFLNIPIKLKNREYYYSKNYDLNKQIINRIIFYSYDSNNNGKLDLKTFLDLPIKTDLITSIKTDKMEGDEAIGAEILKKALEGPMRQIVANAGLEESIVVNEIRKNKSKSYGFDARAEKYLDMIKAGIIDPTLVTRTAVQNAASVAGLLLTTEAVISDKPEPAAPAAPAMPDMGGMGGMGGMM